MIWKRSVPKSDFEQLHTSYKLTEKLARLLLLVISIFTSQITIVGHINIHTFLEQCIHGVGVGLDSVFGIFNITPENTDMLQQHRAHQRHW